MSETSSRESSQFKTMYGKDSQFVDTNKITEIARTMNIPGRGKGKSNLCAVYEKNRSTTRSYKRSYQNLW